MCSCALVHIHVYTGMIKWAASLNFYVNKCQRMSRHRKHPFHSLCETRLRCRGVFSHCCVIWQPNTALLWWVVTGFVATVTLPVSSIPKNRKETNPRRQETSFDCFLKCFNILTVLTFSKTQLSLTKWEQQLWSCPSIGQFSERWGLECATCSDGITELLMLCCLVDNI